MELVNNMGHRFFCNLYIEVILCHDYHTNVDLHCDIICLIVAENGRLSTSVGNLHFPSLLSIEKKILYEIRCHVAPKKKIACGAERARPSASRGARAAFGRAR